MSQSAWPRPLFTEGGGELTVSFVVYAPRLLTWDFTLLEEGSPVRTLPEGLGVQLFARAEAPEFAEWADALVGGSDAPQPEQLGAAQVWYDVGGRCASTTDLSALQAAWAVVRVLCRAGATGVWDSLAMRWTLAAEVLAADPAQPELAAAWEVNAGELEGVPGAEPLWMVHTLGLAKFGRRDLLAFGPARNVGFLRELLAGVAIDLIEGAVLDAGSRIEKAGVRLEAEGYAPDFNGPDVPVPFFEQPLLLRPVAVDG